ncbi:MAG: aldo/keto reductase [Cyanobacteria bacterium J06636_16]
MQYRKLGQTDLMVSEMGLGCSRIGGNLEGGTRKDSEATLLKAFESGVNFFDTADSYGQGQSEAILGKVFQRQRDQVVFATKAGYMLSPVGSLAAKAKPILKPIIKLVSSRQAGSASNALGEARGSFLRQDFGAAHITKSVERSLKRLKTDYIDLFQLHSPPSDVLQSGEPFSVLENLKRQGKIRYYGVSCDTLEDALTSLGYPGVSSVQLELNLLERRPIKDVLPVAQAKGIAVVARQPFASGKLLKPDTISDSDHRQKAEQYLDFASRHGLPITQLSLKLILQLEGVTSVIPGASCLKHLEDNLQALEGELLNPAELAMLLSTPVPT